MKRTGRFYLVIIICIFFLSACVESKVQDLKREVNAEDSLDLSKEKNLVLQQLSELMQVIRDGTQEHGIREKANKDFIELLQSSLSTYDFSDQELSNLYLSVFVCDKQESLQDNTSLRFIVFMSYPEIFGTLERTWTFVEISQGSKKYLQTIYEKTSETPTNCKRIQKDSRDYVLLYGGTTMYTPGPLFISFWELSELELMPGKVINHIDINEENVWDYENELIFEGGQEQWYFDETKTDLTDNPLLSVRLGTKSEIILFYEEGRLVAQKR